MTTRITVASWFDGQPVDVEAWTTLVPGLAIAQSARRPEWWNVLHIRSGGLMAQAHGPEQAQMTAARFREKFPAIDWTASGKEVRLGVRAVLGKASFNAVYLHLEIPQPTGGGAFASLTDVAPEALDR